MATGFEATTVEALVLYGYPLAGLTYAQSERIEKAIARLGSGLLAAPHGDLSARGSPNATTPDAKLAFTFVVGSIVGRARTAATEDATTQSATVTDALVARARDAFEAARPVVDAALTAENVTPGDDPGLLVVAAGPLATARLDADPGATIEEVPDTGPMLHAVRRLDVASRGGPAVRVRLVGTFTLSAKYD